MEGSPFNQSTRTARSPPPTPSRGPPPASDAHLPAPARAQGESPWELVSTPEIQNWLSTIDKYLGEVSSISTEGKLNSDQKLRISTLCRNVGHSVSQMAVHYQSLKQKTIQAHSTIKELHKQLDTEDNLNKKLNDIKLSIEGQAPKPSAGSTFADMVKKGANNYFKPTKLSSIAIYPNDSQKSSEDTKCLVQKIICPEQMQLHVRGVRKTRNGGVIISTDSKSDIDKLKQSAQLKNSGLSMDEPHKRKPRIVVVGVPSSMPEKEVFICLYKQNLAEHTEQFDLDKFLTSIKLSHKSGRKNAETCNYVIEVSAVIRKYLITKERVFVNWSSCPVRDFTLVTRCFKCQQYGHAAKFCREAIHICGHCAGHGHSIKECTKRSEDPICATCSRFKKPSSHGTGAADCPAKVMAENKYINSIDYDGA